MASIFCNDNLLDANISRRAVKKNRKSVLDASKEFVQKKTERKRGSS
jgi:hypothetical protein